jgi:hypothetical protein
VRNVQQTAVVIVVSRRSTPKLKVTVGLVHEEENGRTVHDILASEASLIVIEDIPGEADRRRGHATGFAHGLECSEWVESRHELMSALGGKQTRQEAPASREMPGAP